MTKKYKNYKLDMGLYNTLENIKEEYNLGSNMEAQRFLNAQFMMVGTFFEGKPKKSKKKGGLEGFRI